MARKNTDTVPAMLTPGEFVIKEESAKKIGYGKLNQMNKTGKVNNKEAKMPQGKGTYGSKVGRPPKKAKGYKKGGEVKEGDRGAKKKKKYNTHVYSKLTDKISEKDGKVSSHTKQRTVTRDLDTGERMWDTMEEKDGKTSDITTSWDPKSGFYREENKDGKITTYTDKEFKRKANKISKKLKRKNEKKNLKDKKMQFGGKVSGGLPRHDRVEFDEDSLGGLSSPRGGMTRGYSKGGKVTSEGYPVHGGNGKYKVGE